MTDLVVGRTDGRFFWNLQYLNGSQKRDKKTNFTLQKHFIWLTCPPVRRAGLGLGEWSRCVVGFEMRFVISGLCQEERAGPMILAPRSSLTQGTRCFRIQGRKIFWAVLPRKVRSHYAIIANRVPWASSRCKSSFYFVHADLSLDCLLQRLHSVFLSQNLGNPFAVCPDSRSLNSCWYHTMIVASSLQFDNTGHCGRPRNHNSSAILQWTRDAIRMLFGGIRKFSDGESEHSTT